MAKDVLTPALGAALIAEAAGGLLYDAQVAIECDVAPTTLERWLLNGLDENAVEPYLSFAMSYTRACNKVEKDVIRKALAGSEEKQTGLEFSSEDEAPSFADVDRGDWRAAAWYAEARWPRRYGKGKYTERKRVDALDTVDLMKTLSERRLSLVELFRGDMPPELVGALRACAPEIVAALAGPLLPDQTNK